MGGPSALKYASGEFLPTLINLLQDVTQTVPMHLAVLKTISALCQNNVENQNYAFEKDLDETLIK